MQQDVGLERLTAVHLVLSVDEELAPRSVVEHVDTGLAEAECHRAIGKARLSGEPSGLVGVGQRRREGTEVSPFPGEAEESVGHDRPEKEPDETAQGDRDNQSRPGTGR